MVLECFAVHLGEVVQRGVVQQVPIIGIVLLLQLPTIQYFFPFTLEQVIDLFPSDGHSKTMVLPGDAFHLGSNIIIPGYYTQRKASSMSCLQPEAIKLYKGPNYVPTLH